MADTIFTTQTPPDSATSGGTASARAMRWQNTGSNKVINGGRVWVHNTGIPDGAEWQIWDLATFEKVVTRSLDDATGSDAWFSFAVTPYALVLNRFYYVAVWFPAVSYTYVFDDAGTFNVGSGGVVTANSGIERVGGTVNDLPDTGFAGYYFVDVNVTDATVFGTGTATVGGLTGTSSGVRTVLGTAVTTLGTLTGTGTGLRKVIGTAAASVGELTGTSTGLRKVYGTGSATVGGISGAGIVAAGAQVTSSGWDGLLSILQENRDEYARQRSEPRVACDCGEPLQTGPRGELHCKFDGQVWS